MEIMDTEATAKAEAEKDNGSKRTAAEVKSDDSAAKTEDGIFSDENLSKDSEIIDEDGDKKPMEISASDKIAFVDSVVGNTRFTKEYSMFGGRLKVTLRSLTSDEVNALAVWTAKQGTSDPAGLMAGKYRKYLMAAYVASINGTQMPPLEEPLYETLGPDGKTVNPPGWINRCDFYDGMGYAQFQAILGRIGDFDATYTLLCKKAEDANFWGPDTH